MGAIWPGHGPVIGDALGALDFYIAHRRERLEQVEAAVARLVADHPEGLPADELPRRVVEIVYADVDQVPLGRRRAVRAGPAGLPLRPLSWA